MLQFKVAEAILKKRAGYRDCTIGQDGDDPTIRKLLSKFHGNWRRRNRLPKEISTGTDSIFVSANY